MQLKRSGSLLPLLLVALNVAHAGVQTSPVARLDYTRRNEALAPAATTAPLRRLPDVALILRDARVMEPTAVADAPVAISVPRAPIALEETRAKQVLGPDVRPSAEPQQKALHRFNRRAASIGPPIDRKPPVLVAHYQNGLSAASAANVSRVAVADRTLLSRVNRFVFRKNRVTPSPAPVTPAGGGSASEPRER